MALAGVVAFVAVLLLLHAVKPEVDPSWRFISEYAIGPHGWLMSFAFLAFAVAHVSLATALGPFLPAWSGRVGRGLLLVSAAGLALAGVFTTDPVTAAPEAATWHGRLHALGGSLGFAMPLAAIVLTWQLARHPEWRHARRLLVGGAGLAVLGFLVSVVSLGMLLTRSNGAFGPEVPVGWPTRVEIGTYCVWFTTVASIARRGLRAPRRVAVRASIR